ncbi:MAG TPA: ribulose-phosphate 3-epimerase [bacterium]|jgi:ribulose-phosphate 3-epimerase
MVQIAPSILSADFARLADEVRAVEAAGADLLHVDVMDGHFVPNLTVGPLVVKAVRPHTRLPIDTHLMIEDADDYIPQFAAAGSDFITVHVEACRHLHRTVALIREHGARPGVVLNPATPLCSLANILDEVEMVLLMSVNPGFGGQSYIASSTAKVARLRKMIDDRKLDVRIEIDGGIKPSNCRPVIDAGADILVAGSAIFGSDDYAATIRALRG